ncbi:MAG TPA: family 2A encapsulin nanocompartment cargo protein cysteine desulfurase [Polyangiaceae bacterium]|nr:family 2A encapsulin nanocompartment cargo protein cysteine desulfurase [Polyangiaceae bacterium]
MSIGIEPDAVQLAEPVSGPIEGEAFVAQLTQLANALFQSGGPGQGPSVSNVVPPVAPPGAGPLPGVTSPPNPGPSALAPGVFGVSTAQAGPPTPGFLSAPPIANAPAPKESDLRNVGALFADSLHTQPVNLAETPQPHAGDSAPYFLALAGLPSASSLPPQGSLPGSSSTASQLPGGAPASAQLPPQAPAPQAPAPQTAVPRAPLTSATRSPEAEALPLGAPLPSSAIPGSTDFEPQLFAYQVDEVKAPGQTSGIFDPYTVKRDFPILNERVNGRQLVWLDNAATTQKPHAVIERLKYYYEHENSNIHRAAHALAARASDAYEAARDKVRRFINAPSVKDVIFVRGATEGINLVAQSWGRRNINAGDEIVITWLEHHANIVPWQQLASEKGAKLRVAPVDSRGQVLLEEYEKLLGPRTKLVAITQVSNALGSIVPVQEMTQIAHRYGACVLVDGAQSVSHLRADVQALDCEFFVFSGHKVFAPTGIGVVYGKSAVLEHMPPWQGGGNMIRDVTFERTLYHPAPWRFEAGTGNIGDAVGLGAALDYVSALGIENIARYEHELLEYGTERLHEVPGLTLIGTAADKAGVLSFILDGQRTEDVGGMLDQEGIAVRSGHHCAQPILRRFGLEATVRASLAPYNTREDLDALVAALKRIQVGRPRH